jgi:hypothetical protein
LNAKRSGAAAVAAVSGEVESNPELRDAWRRGLAGTLVASIRTIVARAVERGELPAITDVDLLSVLPLAVLQQWRLVHDQHPDAVVVDRIVRQLYAPVGAGRGLSEIRGDDATAVSAVRARRR